ncbi:DUF4272 domain-containing protein [Aliidiomarina soli]|uniref:DUF4272 domain-containing protein n=1 Tax=Aliidiomarina soli TaxID=1928574 RepID=A0A432WEB1_9GAMM|nr:DUF4272 domain-containing protein [Aliidiomarina soli]RUO31148.1 hypothetical protein CWE14_11680 [Aliidiomarina soli]
MSLREIRQSSQRVAKALGYPTNPNLPLLEPVERLRPIDALVNRTLCLHASVACSYGFQKDRAVEWLKQEGIYGYLAGSEVRYLQGKSDGNKPLFQWQVESLWVMTWITSFHDNLDFSDSCSDGLSSLLPDLKEGAPSIEFKEAAAARKVEEVVASLDLAYCLHWAIRDAELAGRPMPGKVPPLVIRERRRALEWVVSNEDWDDIVLDT